MIKKLVRYGNSQAIVLDRAILELLGIEEGGQVKLSVEGSTLIVKPVELSAPVQAEPISAVKEPEILAEIRKIHEGYEQHFAEDAQIIGKILTSKSADGDLITIFERSGDSTELITALGDFVLKNSPEFKERMRAHVREMMSGTARLFNNRGPAHEAEIQAWYRQEHDRMQEHLESQKIKQEKAYADVKKISAADLNDPDKLEGLLTPEILEQVLGRYMAKLHTEATIGIYQ